jgi:CSLREA domain-containing protein
MTVRFLASGGIAGPFALVSVLLVLLLAHPSPPPAHAGAEVYTVNATDDFSDDACNQVHCSLREAVEYANLPPVGDTIEFDIPASDTECIAGVCTIQLTSSLTLLDGGTTVDGYTQPDASPNTNPFGQALNTDIRIKVEGNNNVGTAFFVNAPNSIIRGLSLVRFTGATAPAIQLGVNADGTHVEGNFIGVGPAGLAPAGVVPAGDTPEGNFVGVGLSSTPAQGLVIGGPDPQDRNLISGNNGAGIEVGISSGVLIENNYIGTDYTGSSPLANLRGIRFFNESHDHLVQHNLVAYNSQYGVVVDGGFGDAEGITISENSIHSNGLIGIRLQSGGNDGIPSPIITGVGPASGTACPSCKIEVFSDDSNEGRIFEGSTNADVLGNWSFPGSLTGPRVTATATDSLGNTSEFSNSVPLSFATPTPAPTSSPTPTPTTTPTPSATPTPTPTPTPSPGPTGTPSATLVWGDNNCADGPNPVDGLFALRFDAGLETNTGDCPEMGEEVDVTGASLHLWGDVDCNGRVDPVDGLKLLRYDAGLEVQQEEGCPEIGEEVEIAS